MLVVDRFNPLMKECNTDFECLKPGAKFPPDNISMARNPKYKFEKDMLFGGEYGKNVLLEISVLDITNAVKMEKLPYRVLPINKFKLYTNKVDSLIFGVGDLVIKADTEENTSNLRKLVERTRWVAAARDAIRLVEINGNSMLRTNANGADAIEAWRGFKVVNEHNKKEVKAIVLFEYIYNKVLGAYDKIRIELHCAGWVAERVYKYMLAGSTSGTIGEPIEYEYRGRTISADGEFYELGFNEVSMVEWLAIDTESDYTGVYGTSPYWDFKDLVFKLEEMLSTEGFVCEAGAKPLLAVSSKLLKPDEKTGGYKLAQIDGGAYGMLPMRDKDDPVPQFINNENAQLEQSAKIRADIEGHIYELMEMNETFMRGTYKGQISDDTLNNTMKGCIDRGERHWWSVYYNLKNSLYCLARLNGLEIPYEAIEISANIGVNENPKQIAETSSVLVDKKILSKESIRVKYFGMTKEQSIAEDAQIEKEAGINEMGRRNEETGNQSGGGSSSGGIDSGTEGGQGES